MSVEEGKLFFDYKYRVEDFFYQALCLKKVKNHCEGE